MQQFHNRLVNSKKEFFKKCVKFLDCRDERKSEINDLLTLLTIFFAFCANANSVIRQLLND